jgi:Ran GTPase-activating protein (RanGAP) involved in mRNA processing and transport
MKEEVSYKKKEKKNPGLRGLICGRNSLEVSNSTDPAELGL